MKRKKSNNNRLLIALGVGAGVYVIFKLVQRNTTQSQYSLPSSQYPVEVQPQPHTKEVQVAMDIVDAATNLAKTIFGPGGLFGKK